MQNKKLKAKVAETQQVPQQVFVPVEPPKIDAGMIVRTIVFVLTLVNGIASMFGFHWNLSIDQAKAYKVISGTLMAASAIWAWWKNNNVTKAARIKQAVAAQVKVNKK